MSSILVVGINGFVGHHLAHELYVQGFEVLGSGMDTELSADLKSEVSSYTQCDLTKPEEVKLISLDAVSAVINLAGLASVGASFGKEDLYNKVNVEVQTNIVDRITELGKNIRVIAVSTGAVYDNHQPMPLNEDSKLTTDSSPYALSKIAMENALQKYIDNGADIVIARPFNHVGPGQLGGFLLPDLATQVVNSNKVTVGNLDTSRDYTDVRDVVKAYVSLATQEKLSHHIYNICSGKSVRGQEILDIIKNKLDKPNLVVEVDQARIRLNDPVDVVGDNSRLRAETGWQPTIKLEDTIADYLDSISKS